jgi:hypothetical protein
MCILIEWKDIASTTTAAAAATLIEVQECTQPKGKQRKVQR